MRCTLPPDGLLELCLGHLRPALDVLLLGLVVELVPAAALGAAVRAQPAAPAGGHVVRRGAALLLGLPRACPLLVHGARRDLLGDVLAAAALLQTGLDVLVLAFALRARSCGHD